MPQYIRLPPERLSPEAFQALMEEYVSRDGTDYGMVELSLEEKVANIERQIRSGEIYLLYELESEQWDLLSADEAAPFITN